MKKLILLFISIFYLGGCKYTLPEALITQTCSSSNTVSYSVDPLNYKKYNFTLSNLNYLDSPVTWSTSTGSVLGTSSSNTFSYPFSIDGTYSVNASYKNKCGDTVKWSSSSFTIIKGCAIPSGISVFSASSSGAYTFKLDGSLTDVVSVIWKITNSSNVVVNQSTNSNANNFETALGSTGSYTATADVSTSCGNKYLYSTSFTYTGTASSIKDIYICGYEGNAATYWKNGTAYQLTNGNNKAIANSIQVIGNDVYVAGYEFNGSVNVAKYWKNGVATLLTDGSKEAAAVEISVIGNDIYVAGHEFIGSNLSAKYWKNGVATNLSNGTGFVYAHAINIKDNNVYVAGEDWTNKIGKYWKNGVETRLGHKITDIGFIGNDMYVTGRENDKAVYWKNGSPIDLPNGFEARNISISGNSLNIIGINSASVPKYWTNGTEKYLEQVVSSADAANSIFANGSDIFIAGMLSSGNTKTAYYWINGKAIKLSNNTNSAANSIFVILN
jgi:hypothetical protein